MKTHQYRTKESERSEREISKGPSSFAFCLSPPCSLLVTVAAMADAVSSLDPVGRGGVLQLEADASFLERVSALPC